MDIKIPVLMFHAISSNGKVSNADPHYAIDFNDYKNFIDYLKMRNIKINSLRNLIIDQLSDAATVSFTFDDGHESNYTMAYPILEQNSFSADFFINTAFVGSKGYMNWEQIDEMNRNNMSIQSHGHHHYYFDEISEKVIRNELSTSKNIIEDKLGSEVTIFAPPGGRITDKVKSIAAEIGYTTISTSRPGVWNNSMMLGDIPRLPVLKSTSNNVLQHWAMADRSYIYKLIAKYYTTYLAKQIFGNKLYDRLRNTLLGG